MVAPEDNKEAKVGDVVELKAGEIVVDQKTLATVLEKQAEMEKILAEKDSRMAGLEEMFAADRGPDTVGAEKGKLRERKDHEPQFRTVRLRKYPMAGDVTNQGWVIGWTDRGAYHKVDKSGVSAQLVDWIDIIFLDHEKGEDGKLVAESVPLLDLLNKGEQVHCRILDIKDYKGQSFKPSYPSTFQAEKKVGTGEEIRIKTFDQRHGLMESDETIDGYVGFTDLRYVVQIPGRAEPFEIDGKYVN